MKRELIMLIVVAVVLAVGLVCVSWHFGHQNGRLVSAQESTDARVIDLDFRLLPLEKDFQRREAIWGKISTVFSWIRGKLGF